MRKHIASPIALAASLPLCSFALCARAQTTAGTDQPVPPAATHKSRELNFLFSGGYEQQFSTDIDNGGDFSVSRVVGGLAVQTNLSDDFEMSIRFNYGLEAYDFSDGALGAAANSQPWDDIHTINGGVIFTYSLTDRWSLFGGPVVQLSRESGADWNDSIMGGGALGASFQVSDELALGAGLIVVSQLEDDPRIWPILILQWKISDTLRLANRTASSVSGRPGVELIYAPLPQWEFAVGGASQFSRFRLDDEGIAPNGVGQDESMPFWVRASYNAGQRVRIDGFVGMSIGGKLRLEDSDGHKITSQDYDAPLSVGLFGSVRF